MAWKGVITNAGAALLDQWALGGTLAITSAATGTGTVSESAMMAQTSLVSGKQTASIISSEKLTAGIKLKLQITAPRTTYLLQQYGVWASLSGGTAVLLALFQNPTGITIPSSTESPDFVYTLFALMKISNTGELTVTVDTSALVSQSTLDEAMATKVDKVSGKGLSTNDYTMAEKEKLAGIEAQANKYTHPAYTARTGKPTANLTPGFGDTVTVSQITSDATGHVTGATDRTIKIPATAASTSAAGLMSAADKTKLNGVATGAEVNQNAFANVKVGSTTVAADAKQDTLELVAGSNVTITPDATNDKVTIAAKDTTYSSEAAASGGTEVSLVTTGEKYNWNRKANGSHTHSAGDINSGTFAPARLPTATASAQGAVKLGAAGGVAAYSHTHTTDAVTDLVTATKYGPMGLVSFNGKEGLPLKSWLVDIEPVQEGSGDPSPSNIRPISGWTGAKVSHSGKNMLRLETRTSTSNGVSFAFDQNAGTIHATGASTAAYSTASIAEIRLGQGSYIISGCPSSGGANKYIIRDMQYTADNTFVRVVTDAGSGGTIAVTDETIIHKFDIVVYSGAGTVDVTFQPMLRLAAGTDAAFEPFKGEIFDVSFPSEAGTVYGGTLDVLKGTLTVTWASVVIGDKSWSYSANDAVFYSTGFGDKAPGVTNLMAEAYKTINVDSVSKMTEASVKGHWSNKNVYVKDTRYSTAASFLAAMGASRMAYALESPVTYQLTPELVTALAGQNSFWCDAGETAVEYGAFLAAEAEARNIASDILDANKSDKDHTHGAWDITQGILPVDKGGTGNSTGYVTFGRKSGTTLGQYATAEGHDTTATGTIGAHAEGYMTVASGVTGAHAEGSKTKASGGAGAHAEGVETEASGGFGAHAEGCGTIAAGETQHVFGRYNAANSIDVEIVGWGASTSARKNIRTLDTSGNMTITGTLTQNSDARLKDVQGEIPDVSGIRAVRFKWNDTNGEHDDKDHIGYIAQEVEKIAPFLVGDDSNGYKSLDYIALLCAKVEMLERQVMELKAEQNKQ